MTVLDLIKSSLRLIHQLGPGRSPSNSEAADALLVFNSMLDSWSTERLAIHEIRRDTYPWTGGAACKTIGPGGHYEAPRPVRITEAGIIVTDDETPLDICCARKWATVSRKYETGTPRVLHNDGGHPRSGLWLWPVPESDLTLVLYAWRVLIAFANVNQDVDFPPGYFDAIRYNLAVHLGEEWGKQVSERTERMAADKKGWIKALNMPTLEMGVDDALVGPGRTDFFSGG